MSTHSRQTTGFVIRQARTSDAQEISALISDWAHHYLDDPAPREAAPFLESLTPSATAERIDSPGFRYYVAENLAGLCGVIALRERSHLYHLFVREDAQGQGVARALWEHAKSRSGNTRFTVNSALPAVAVYERFGFVAMGAPQSKHGVSYVPMEYVPES